MALSYRQDKYGIFRRLCSGLDSRVCCDSVVPKYNGLGLPAETDLEIGTILNVGAVGKAGEKLAMSYSEKTELKLTKAGLGSRLTLPL